MLASFEKTLAKHIANRDRIAGKLAALDLLAMPSDTEPLALRLVRVLKPSPVQASARPYRS